MAIHRAVKLQPTIQTPITVERKQKREMRSQFAALCYTTEAEKTRILLISSRDTGRWILPKGWPMDGRTPAEAAATEAYEEAGVDGQIFDHVLGMYYYDKGMGDDPPLPCIVTVFPMKVHRLLKNFPERAERRRKWFSPAKAAERVNEPELAKILRAFTPLR